ncbi:MerR family transcriptional regulator [Nannocystis bainbridge]|uniref:MerR family transcriptional regulator n=1 Tax=Nannocystis bainbridge TaxID=2995303 RepID=UPI00358DC986
MSDDTSGASGRPWRTTAEIAEAVGVDASTITRWGREGVMPKSTIVHGGRRGRSARWPLHSVSQAAWVQSLLENGFSFEEIRSKLAAGEFKPSSDGGQKTG